MMLVLMKRLSELHFCQNSVSFSKQAQEVLQFARSPPGEPGWTLWMSLQISQAYEENDRPAEVCTDHLMKFHGKALLDVRMRALLLEAAARTREQWRAGVLYVNHFSLSKAH